MKRFPVPSQDVGYRIAGAFTCVNVIASAVETKISIYLVPCAQIIYCLFSLKILILGTWLLYCLCNSV